MTKSLARISASLVISQTADHSRVLGSDSVTSAMPSIAVRNDVGSSRALQ